LARHEFYPGIGDGTAKCPFDPEDNSTAVWVENGNPGDLLPSTVAPMLSLPKLMRLFSVETSLMKLQEDVNSLSKELSSMIHTCWTNLTLWVPLRLEILSTFSSEKQLWST